MLNSKFYFPNLLLILCIFFGSLFAGLIFSHFLRKLNILDKPDGIRKLHSKPTPFAGGLVLFALFFSTLKLHPSSYINNFYILSLIILFLLGFLDDLFNLPVLPKLLVQLISTLLISIPVCDSIYSIIFATFFYTTFINSVNFIDNSSGVCLTFLIFAFLFLYIFSGNLIHLYYLIALVALLLLNLPSEKLFLGNNGTFFIGAYLAVTINIILEKSFSATNYFYCVTFTLKNLFFLLTPFLDFFVTVARRFYAGFPIYKADNRHITFILENIFKSKEIALVIWSLFLYLILLTNIIFVKNNISYVYSAAK